MTQRKTRIQFAAAFVVATLAWGGQALAQPASPASPKAKMGLSEMAGHAQSLVEEMSQTVGDASQLLEQARKKDDLPRVNCINEALTAMKGLLKLSERNQRNLRDASVRGDRETAEHEHIKITIAHGKMGELDAQVRSCGGPDAEGTVDGRPVIEKILDDDLPLQDPVEQFKDVDVVVDRPPSASQIF